MIIATAAVDVVCTSAGVDRVGSIAAGDGVVASAAINEESIVRTGGGDAVASGACIDALEIIGDGAADACGSPIVGAAGVGGSNSASAVAVVEGVVVAAKGYGTSY